MQDKKIRASINAKFDFDSGTLEAKITGSHLAVCFLLGQLIQNSAKSKSKVKGIPEDQALEEVFRIVNDAAHFSAVSEYRIDLSHESKEAGHD